MNMVSLWPNIAGDYACLRRGSPSVMRLVFQYISNPGFRAILLFRCAHALFSNRWVRLAACVRSLCVSSTGCDISPEACIGEGLLLHHPVGIVIGCGARIGRGCTVLQNVTIGERYSPLDDHRYPQIGDGVIIGAGAVLLGPISVGSGAIIGANSVVLSDIPDGAIAVGQPARLVEKSYRYELHHVDSGTPVR